MNKKTNKTAHVLKLLTNVEEPINENPILNAEFKDEMIHSRTAINNPTVNVQKPSSVDSNVPKAVGINIISELVQENLPIVLERFRCCSCEICKAELTVAALNQIPPQYAYVTNKSFDEVNSLKGKYKGSVINVLVKLVINIKSNPIHK